MWDQLLNNKKRQLADALPSAELFEALSGVWQGAQA